MMKKITSVVGFVKEYLIRLHNDSLYRNSFYLIASQVVLAGLGFLFWVINARLFSATEIGIATTLISVTGMITSFSMMGFNIAMVRYLPEEKQKNTFVNTAYAIVSIAAIVLTVAFLIGLPFFSPPLVHIFQNKWVMFFLVLFMVVSTINAITDSVFIALRSTQYILFVGIAVGIVKLITPLIFKNLGTNGVFFSYVAGVSVGMILSLVFLTKFELNFIPLIKKSIVQKVWKFSSGNYFAGLVGMLNGAILPILITNSLGTKMTAYYYMPTMILSLMQSFPRSMGSSFFAEGSLNGSQLRKMFFKSLKAIYVLMVPATILLIFFGQFILLAFGKSYSSEGIMYLRLTLIALLISVPNYLFGSILSIRKKVSITVFMSVFGAVLGISLTVFMLKFGLTGLGTANIIGQFINFSVFLILIKFGALKVSGKIPANLKPLNPGLNQ